MSRGTPVDFVKRAKEEAAYINNEKEQYLQQAEKANSEANTTTRTLSSQLFLVSGAIITISAALLSNDALISNLSIFLKIVLIISWIAFVIAVLFGLLQIRRDYGFFVGWGKYNSDIAEELGTGRYSSANIHNAIGKFEKPPNSSTSTFTSIQSIAVILGIVLFVVVISFAIFLPSQKHKSYHPFNHKWGKKSHMRSYAYQLP